MKLIQNLTALLRGAMLAILAAGSLTISHSGVVTSTEAYSVVRIPTWAVSADRANVLQVTRLTSYPGAPDAALGTLGVWFAGTQWAIYRQDRNLIPRGAQFMVLAAPADSNRFVHTTESRNAIAGLTYLNHRSCNGRPDAKIHVVAEYSPTYVFSGYHDSELGVYYDAARKQWAIFNQGYNSSVRGSSPMPIGLRLHITVDSPPMDAWEPTHFTHTTSTWNTVGNISYLPAVPPGGYYTSPDSDSYITLSRSASATTLGPRRSACSDRAYLLLAL